MPLPDHRKLWIDLEGRVLPVRDSHEEFANAMGWELETLLESGWVRVQDVPPLYLYIQFGLRMNGCQIVALQGLFSQNRFEKILVEFGGEVRTFTDPQTMRALAEEWCFSLEDKL